MFPVPRILEDIVEAICMCLKKGIQVARGAKGVFHVLQIMMESRTRPSFCLKRACKTKTWCRQHISLCLRTWR